MTSAAQLRTRFEADLASVVCSSTAPRHLAKLIALVLSETPELAAVPPEERSALIERLAVDLAKGSEVS